MREKFFVCDGCDSIESTTKGNFHSYNNKSSMPKDALGRRLCSACAPIYDAQGRCIPGNGRWHGTFPRRVASVSMLAGLCEDIVYFGRFEADVRAAVASVGAQRCVKCASTDIGVARSMTGAVAVCMKCGMYGPMSDSMKEAVVAWNGAR